MHDTVQDVIIKGQEEVHNDRYIIALLNSIHSFQFN